MPEKNLVTQPKGNVPQEKKWEQKPVVPIDPRKAMNEFLTPTNLDMYRPFGAKKDSPTANLVRAWGKMEKLNFRVTKCEKNDEYVEVWGEGWNDDRTIGHAVIIRYKDVLRLSIWAAIKNGMSYSYKNEEGKYQQRKLSHVQHIIDDNGFPVITDKEALAALLYEHTQKIYFLERIAQANVERACFLELLDKDDPDGAKIPVGEESDQSVSETEGTEGTQEGEEERKRQEELISLRQQIINKCMESVGQDRKAAAVLFTTATEKAGKRLTRSSDIEDVETAKKILAAIPEKIIDEKISEADILDVFPGAEAESKDDPLQSKREMIKMEVEQIASSERGKLNFLAFDIVDLQKTFSIKAGLKWDEETLGVVTEADADKFLQELLGWKTQI